MRYAVLGGDLRFVHLVDMLKEGGRDARGFLQGQAGGQETPLRELKARDCIITNWPLRCQMAQEECSEAEIMENIAPGSVLLICGPKFPARRRWDLQYINLWQDETLLRENAWITAEGAVASAMQRIGRPLSGLGVLVVGCGRIGRALVEILRKMDAKVTLVSRSEAKRREMQAQGVHAIPLEGIPDALPGHRLVFSTPPAMVLPEEALNYADRDALIVDLASPPYGVDLDAARKLGLQAVREPGLPGRCCPMAAARAIYGAVLRWEEGERHG